MTGLTKKFLLIVKIICLLILIKSVFNVTFDYFKYGFEYKLIVSDNTLNGFDLPAISVCTESNVLFDKWKAIKHFGVEQQWDEYHNQMYEHFKNMRGCHEVNYPNGWSFKWKEKDNHTDYIAEQCDLIVVRSTNNIIFEFSIVIHKLQMIHICSSSFLKSEFMISCFLSRSNFSFIYLIKIFFFIII